jgi:hydroxylamine reductase (hybrid-cluster protein)
VKKLAEKKQTLKNTVEATPQKNKNVNKDKTAAIETITTTEGSFIRNIVKGTEYYSGRAKMVTKEFIAAAKGQKSDSFIKDEAKLIRIAAELGIKTSVRPINEIAAELGELILSEFGKQEGELLFLKRAPLKRQEIWRKRGVAPAGIDIEINAAKKIAGADRNGNKPGLQAERCALTNGWGSNMIAADLQDIMSGTPSPALKKEDKSEMVTGFSPEAIIYSLGGSFRGSLHPLIDNIVNGRIRGIAGIFNCHDRNTNNDIDVRLVKELIKNDVLVLFTGDDAAGLAQAGLMVYEGAQYAGEGLHSVCEAVGLPPVLHMGTSTDNCRILIAASAIVQEAKLGDISDLPACIASTEGMSEKTIAIGQCLVSSGFYTISFGTLPMEDKLLSGDTEKMFGEMWDFETDPLKMAQKMITHIDEKRKALGIDKARERVMYDMAMRRELS